MKVYEYINSLLSVMNNNDFHECDFSILCEKYPIMTSNNSFRARVLYVSLTNRSNNTMKFYPDKLTELGLDYVTITTNLRRRLTMKAQEFFINGNTEPQEYKGNNYYNYSLEKTSMITRNKIKELREKYNIQEPELFIGKHHDLILN